MRPDRTSRTSSIATATRRAPVARALLTATLLAALPLASHSAQAQARAYDQLLRLFTEWRTFEDAPRLASGIPDYSPATNAHRLAALRRLQARLAAIDTTGWSVKEQVDWHLVRAEMNGMEYFQRVLKPWARDPAYYASVVTEESDTPAKEGPLIHGAIRLFEYPIWPRTRLDTARALTTEQGADLAKKLRTIPPLLQAARRNLAAGNARDLWLGGSRAFEEQAEALKELGEKVGDGDAALAQSIREARTASEDFASWVAAEAKKKTGPSGIGKEQYTWYLRNVLLVPLSWDDEVAITRRELMRGSAALRLEENRNRNLPQLPIADTPEDYAALQARAIPRYLKWIADNRILTYEPWMERALRERTAGFAPAASRNFFQQATQRDPLPLWTHLSHWWDNMRMRVSPHASPIRRTPLLYNVWMSRAEGMATSFEEWMMHAGLYDDSPRSREIVWIMLVNRAARGLGNLYAHSNELTMAQAGDIHMNWTPRGWMRRDPLLGFEQHLYLRQPGYGASYITGGRLMEETIALRARQLGDQFTLQRVMDEINAAGMIPVSMIYWEVTGDDRMVRELKEGRPLPPMR
ncbi:MAG: DUF885 family protein [Gemmatimonadaceae bacterium]|nr:DUF885 family protein [Gemmatimonadaceae bacterium]